MQNNLLAREILTQKEICKIEEVADILINLLEGYGRMIKCPLSDDPNWVVKRAIADGKQQTLNWLLLNLGEENGRRD